MQPLAALKILRPKKFEIWGKDVGMVWKLFVEGALESKTAFRPFSVSHCFSSH